MLISEYSEGIQRMLTWNELSTYQVAALNIVNAVKHCRGYIFKFLVSEHKLDVLKDSLVLSYALEYFPRSAFIGTENGI